MLCEAKSDRLDECIRLGREIGELKKDRDDLQSTIRELEVQTDERRTRVSEIADQIESIQFAQDSARALGARGGIAGGIAAEVTAQAIRLARQKDRLEQEKQRLEAQLSRLGRALSAAERRLAETNGNLSQFNAAFQNLDCPLGAIPF